jgi:hypothetical protein
MRRYKKRRIIMRKGKMFALGIAVAFLMVIALGSGVWAQVKYEVGAKDLEKYKEALDDPSPFYTKTEGFKKLMPPEAYAKVTYDVEAMKKGWADVIGFKAPDVVGKTYPEIKPGKYTYKDKAKLPFDKLMWKLMYDRFNPTPTSGKRHAGNFTEIEVVPTRQYYHSLPVVEATKKYAGTVKQQSNGYIDNATYVAGFPFPRPSGATKAQQIMHNWEKNYNLDGEFYVEHVYGYTSDLRNDYEGRATAYCLRLQGRVKAEPLGWLDSRAKDQQELKVFQYMNQAPRDLFGNIINITQYIDPNKDDLFLMYINSLRRIRKMTASDTQDPAVGQDMIYEDWQGFNQKLSPKRFPYKYEVISEGEYLVPITTDGAPYLSTKEGLILKNLQFERRPIWVLQLTQLDKNYVYGKRIMYIDREILYPHHIEAYDQKGRLYRTYDSVWGFIPAMGTYNQFHTLALDHIDVHSTAYHEYSYPAAWLGRADVSMGGMQKTK